MEILIYAIIGGIISIVFGIITNKQKKVNENGKTKAVRYYFSPPTPILSQKSDKSRFLTAIKYEESKQDPSKKCGEMEIQIKGLYYRHEKVQKRAKEIPENEELFLEREYNNPADPYAVRVKTWDGYDIGYIEGKYSQFVAECMEKQFRIECFLSFSSSHRIPYQRLVLFYCGDNPKYKPPKQTIIVDDDYYARIHQLKDNIKRSKMITETTDRDNIRQNALKRIARYEEELSALESKMNAMLSNNAKEIEQIGKNQRIEQLKENIRNAKKVVASTTKDTIRNNAFIRIAKYEKELQELDGKE